MFDQRKLSEIEHGAKIVDRAERFWGHSKKAGRQRILRRIKLMVEWGAINNASKVLEIGAGTGEFTRYLAESGAQITAVDISPDLLAVARKKLDGCRNVQFIVGDAEELGALPDNYFTNIVGNAILHHLDCAKALRTCWSKLWEDGSVFFTEPNMLNPQIALQKTIPWLKKLAGDSPDETAFFRWQIKKVLKQVGYRDIIVRNFDFLHPFLPDSLADVLNMPLRVLEFVPLVREFSGSLLIYAKKG